MFKIVRFPKKLESFFDSLKDQFHWDHFPYFCTLVLLMTISWGRKNIAALYRHLVWTAEANHTAAASTTSSMSADGSRRSFCKSKPPKCWLLWHPAKAS